MIPKEGQTPAATEPQTPPAAAPAEPQVPEFSEADFMAGLTQFAKEIATGVSSAPTEPTKPAEPTPPKTAPTAPDAQFAALQKGIIDGLKPFLEEFRASVITEAQKNVTQTVERTTNDIETVRAFFTANPQLTQHREIIGIVSSKLRSQNPDKPLLDILNMTKEKLGDFNKTADNTSKPGSTGVAPSGRPNEGGTHTGISENQKLINKTFNFRS